jgi:hypothetical protein
LYPSLSIPFLINGESSIRSKDEGAFLQIPEGSVNSKNEAMGFLKIELNIIHLSDLQHTMRFIEYKILKYSTAKKCPLLMASGLAIGRGNAHREF